MTDAVDTHDDFDDPAQGPDASAAGPLPGADDDFGLAPRPRQRKPRPDPLVGRDLGGVRIDALALQRGQHAAAAHQRDLALGAAAAHQHGDLAET